MRATALKDLDAAQKRELLKVPIRRVELTPNSIVLDPFDGTPTVGEVRERAGRPQRPLAVHGRGVAELTTLPSPGDGVLLRHGSTANILDGGGTMRAVMRLGLVWAATGVLLVSMAGCDRKLDVAESQWEWRTNADNAIPITGYRGADGTVAIPETNGTVGSTNKDMTIDLGDGVKMEMVWIPPGAFLMGGPTNEFGRSPDETQHRVTLTKGFWMGKHEVTQERWQKVVGRNPSSFKGAKNPVETVSWYETQDFIKKLNETIRGGGFRLPTEAEWEYACRAGTKTKFYSGDNDNDLAEAGWYNGNSGDKTHPVGEKKANAFGLFDMHGNVWEWCQDWYGDYPSDDVSDPTGPLSGSFRVLRGGSWNVSPAGCRSALRVDGGPTNSFYYSGFRVVLVR